MRFVKNLYMSKSRLGLYSFGFCLVLSLIFSACIIPVYQAQAEVPTTPQATTSLKEVKPGSAISSPVAAPTPTITASPTPTATTATPTPTTTLTPTPGVSATPDGGVTTVAPPPSVSPTPTQEEKDKQKAEEEKAKKEEEKKQALAKAQNYVLSRGQPTAEAIDNWLARCNSPQLQEALPGKTMGQTYLELGWKYGINPAYALAFFTKESSCGTAGSNLAAHDFGNIRWSAGYPTLDQVWRAYPTWTAGMEDWFKLLKDNYLTPGARTLADVIPTYAPETENDTTLYLNEVMDWVDAIMAYSPDYNLNLSNSQYFEATGFQVGWNFLDYWQKHGQVTTLGWPISNQEYEGGKIVQYFERGVLEYHPENQPPYQVMLRDLGREAGKEQAALVLDGPPDEGAIYFSQTDHWLSGHFVKTWQQLGGLTQFGYPIAEPEVQGTILIQWFERARFEIDLSQSDAQVKLGLVGSEAIVSLQAKQDSSNSPGKPAN